MPLQPDLPKAEVAIIEQTNAFRAGGALNATKGEPVLTKAARDYARFLAATTIFSHEADGRRPQDRVQAAGYAACSTAENLFLIESSAGFETQDLAKRMVEGWKASPGHRKNMLLPSITETGVGIAKASRSEKYIGVQLFARPMSMMVKFRIRNETPRAVSFTLGGKSETIGPQQMFEHRTCESVDLAVATKAEAAQSRAAVAQYRARDGETYVFKQERGGGMKVEVIAPAQPAKPNGKP